jgi:hypothetical protein
VWYFLCRFIIACLYLYCHWDPKNKRERIGILLTGLTVHILCMFQNRTWISCTIFHGFCLGCKIIIIKKITILWIFILSIAFFLSSMIKPDLQFSSSRFFSIFWNRIKTVLLFQLINILFTLQYITRDKATNFRDTPVNQL